MRTVISLQLPKRLAAMKLRRVNLVRKAFQLQNAGDAMMEIQETPIATTADAAEAPQTEKNESKFGDAAKDSKEQISEDDAAAQLGDFA